MNSNLDELLLLVSETLQVNINALNISSGIDNTPEWDSINHMSLILALESKYSIELTGDEIGELTTINRIYDCLKSKQEL